MQHQQRLVNRSRAQARRGEVAAEDFFFGDAWVGKEPVGRLGVGPILTRQRNGMPDSIGHEYQARYANAFPAAHPESALPPVPDQSKPCPPNPGRCPRFYWRDDLWFASPVLHHNVFTLYILK